MKKKLQQILSGVLCTVIMAGLCGGQVRAIDIEEEAKKAYEMPIQSNEQEGWPQGPKVYGKSAIVMDADTKAVLYAKNIDDRHFPASITKIMTAVLAMENGDLNTDKVLFSQESIDFLQPGDAYIAMRPGEEISLKDAMYGMMLASANEVSYAIAENIGKKLQGNGTDYEKFITAMNERAKQLGAKNTNFVNPHGLHNENHYTSVYDMALISAELFKYPEILEIMQTGEYTIPPTNLEKEPRIFQQKHEMLLKYNKHFYQYCVGGKTGYTDEAGNTLVTLADNGKMRLVCVEMETRGQHIYDDTKNLLDYGFRNFGKQEVKKSILEKIEKKNRVQIKEDTLYVTMPNNGEQTELDIRMEDSPSITYKNQTVGKVDAEKQSSHIKKDSSGKGKELIEKIDLGKLRKNSKLLIGIVAAAVVVLLLIVLLIIRIRRKKRRRSFLNSSRKVRARERKRQRKMRRAAKKNQRRRRKRW